jgi:plasmid stabilization system protein ParE
MGRFQFTPQALDDLFEIWSYIARNSPAAADRAEEAIYLACELLAGSPLAGTVLGDRGRRFQPLGLG